MTLLEEIRDKCPPELVARRDDAAIAALLSVGKVEVGLVSTSDFVAWAAATGLRAVIEDEAQLKTSPLRSTALALMDVLGGAVDGINFLRPGNRQMLASWVQLGKISQAQADSLLALATHAAPVDVYAVTDALDAALPLTWTAATLSSVAQGVNVVVQLRFTCTATGATLEDTLQANDLTPERMNQWRDLRLRQLTIRDNRIAAFAALPK